MSKRIIFTRPDGGVSVIVPAPGIPMERVMQDIPTDALSHEVVDVEVLPTDRTFRNAWKQEGKTLKVDVEKAKDIVHEKRRAVRSAEFAPLDIEATIPSKAVEAEAKRAAVRAKHEAIQLAVEAATTPDKLKEIVEAL